jgi:acyl-CoA reductase-like NAD-dependent aldehyde dehydrogenase
MKNYIAGEWVSGGSAVPSINPSDTSDMIGEFAQASAEDVVRAIAAAREAQALWQRTGLEARQAVLMQIGTELMARAEELGRLLSREEGKPFPEGRGEVYRAGQFFAYYAAEVLRQIGETADSVRGGIEIDIRREPVGVVAVISPWNFPLATASWKIAPALAFGNAVVWKPANLTPAIAVALTDIVSRTALPQGTFNLVMGSGGVAGQALVTNPHVNAVTFTGSLDVGRQVNRDAAWNLVRVQLEMGSKNALIIMDDCDIDLAVKHALNGAFGGTGQKCTASSRLVVHHDILDEFTRKLVSGAKAIRVGHALDEGTEMGPAVSAAQLQSNLSYVELGKSEGAALLTGGEEFGARTPGHYMTPAIFTETNNSMRINREEIFGPITCIIPVPSYEEALEVTNDTPFGLTAGIMTNSLARATHFRRNARSGCVMVNLPTAGTDYHVPFGGRGQSSLGPREQGRHAMHFYTAVKTSYISSGALP